MSVRVRFAPSPTGALHLGGARTALFNWLFARHHKGKFILRIEDTDRVRSTKEAIKAIIDGMQWLGLDWDEGPEVGGVSGPYFQTERLEHDKKYIQQLLDEGKAYHCFCSAEELAEKRKQAELKKEAPRYDGKCRKLSAEEIFAKKAQGIPSVVRFLTPAGEKTVVNDMIRGKIEFDNDLLDDFVILKSDGFPTYNFAVAVDDHLMAITHVIRGDDHLSNTPRQVLIYRSFGWEAPPFAHIPMILGPDKARLSKRHGATSVIEYQNIGYLPEAMINYLAKLGWGYKDKEVFSRQELVELFSLDGVNLNPAIFNFEKLNWLNAHYIKTAIPERIVDLCEPMLIDAYGKRDLQFITRIVKLFLDRLKLIPEIVGLTEYFFKDDYTVEAKASAKLNDPQSKEILLELSLRLSKIDSFVREPIEKVFKEMAAEKALKLGMIIHPCRAAVSGRLETPPMYDVLEVLGKDKVLFRMNQALNS